MAEIKNLNKAVKRIKKAIEKKERIILYGDADLDGVSSVVILREAIKNAGGDVLAVYFPDREVEGYGISEKGLEYLRKFAPALLISLDCGITSFKPIEKAKKLKLEVIVVDHHPVIDKLPAAKIIVDPKQKADKYPFKGFANAGLTFKLSEVLLENKMTDILRKDLLELVALATIADMMPQENENLLFTEEGLQSFKTSFRPALKVFREIKPADDQINFPAFQIAIQALNASSVNDGISEAYTLLTTPSEEEARGLAEYLLLKGEAKRAKIRDITEEIENRIARRKKDPVIFEGDPGWDAILLGSIASRLCDAYEKPAFIYKKMGKESIGSVRAPKGIDSVASMKDSENLFITFGGHAPASGFRIKNENLEKLETNLIKYFKKRSK